jgi:hypothetical protein
VIIIYFLTSFSLDTDIKRASSSNEDYHEDDLPEQREAAPSAAFFHARSVQVWHERGVSKKQVLNRVASELNRFSIVEYPLIILFITIGSDFLINSGDVVSMFLSIELQSYGLYIFAALYKDSE